jgi:hypothetical protein
MKMPAPARVTDEDYAIANLPDKDDRAQAIANTRRDARRAGLREKSARETVDTLDALDDRAEFAREVRNAIAATEHAAALLRAVAHHLDFDVE